jgi:hypothetical protein
MDKNVICVAKLSHIDINLKKSDAFDDILQESFWY